MSQQLHSKKGALALGFAASFLQTSTFQLAGSFHGLTKCSNASNYTSSDESSSTSHSYVSSVCMSHGLLIQNLIAVLPCVFLPSWSDKHGRKLLMLLPLLGLIFYDVQIIAFSFFSSVSEHGMFFSTATYALFGTSILATIGCICYVTDRTDFRSRTWYIGLLLCLINMGEGLGELVPRLCDIVEPDFPLSRLILIVFIAKIMIELLLVVVVKVVMTESVFMLGDFNGNPWKNVIAPINVADAVHCVFKRRISNVRFFIIVSLTTFSFWCIVWFGNGVAVPVYLVRAFQWSSYGTEALRGLGLIALSCFSIMVVGIARAFHFLDASLGIAGCISLAASSLLLAVSSNSLSTCIALSCGILALMIPISIISVLSKLAEHNETGGMFAAVGFLTLVIQLIATVSYSQLQELCFAATIPGVVFLLSFGVSSLALFHFIYLRKNISPELVGHISFDERMLLLGRGNSDDIF